jgi:hypothetical protein
VNTSYSPGVRRLMARAGSQTQFEQAAQDLRCYAGLEIEPREIERVAEEVGRQVEQWLCEEQEQIRHTVVPASPRLRHPDLYRLGRAMGGTKMRPTGVDFRLVARGRLR